MIERIRFEAEAGELVQGAVVRYEMLYRLARAARQRGVAILAFGLEATRVRTVVEGDREKIAAFIRTVQAGTCRAMVGWRLHLAWGPAAREEVAEDDLAAAVAWAHRAGLPEDGDPLSTPWTSHRDLMGYRKADFYDPSMLTCRVDRVRVHRLAGGVRLPEGWPPATPEPEPLARLLRVAGAVLGVLPTHRSCFRLFVHLGRTRGWGTSALADALVLTPRRIRQLAAEPEDRLPLALLTLAEEGMRVP